jgi:two-component system NtrC family sensor kinase
VFNLNKLSGADTLLSGWKIKTGDNPQYSSQGYDDGKWTRFDPSTDINAFSRKDDICWLRLHLRIDSALRTTDFGFMVNQNVASEIYVDGKLFKNYGSLAGDTKAYNPVNRPDHVQLMPGLHLVAVRFRIQKQWLNIDMNDYSTSIFNLNINRYSDAISNFEQITDANQELTTENLILIGIFFILTVTHMVFYRYYRKQKAHLYYGIVTFLLLCDTWLNIVLLNQHSLVSFFWLNDFGNLTFVGFVFLPLTIYALFGYKKRGVIKIILALSCVSLLTLCFTNTYENTLFFVMIPLINAAECVRVGIWARKNKKSGSLFVVAGSSLFLVLLVLQNFIPGSGGEIVFMLSLLSLPVGMTIFLAIQTAITYRSLETKLNEVQELSEKNMQFQIERQQILATQNETLEQQVTERTAELSATLNNLRSTQNQLVQAEKMASLGELTAGIAHEIQNPLNFVNNFSEVNREMIDELREELQKGDIEEALAIANDIQQNEEKINHHGKRADFIVKGMLEHSRTSTGAKQLTDLNVLCDEFMKLSYHGLRAKDKIFNAELATHFDLKLPKVNVSQQNIGRVMLNLFNNAFYTVNQKSKTAGPDYKPEVTVSTSAEKDNIIIKVHDNGNGIPDAIKDKIMQPFFTTKPTGEGTGLGLSLSYDIVVKGHGGSITVDTKEGEFTEFTVSLPLA